MLLTHHATVNPDIHSLDISATAIAVHQSGSDGNYAGQRSMVDSDWNVPFVGKHNVRNIGDGENSYLGSTDFCNWRTIKMDGNILLLRRGQFKRMGISLKELQPKDDLRADGMAKKTPV